MKRLYQTRQSLFPPVSFSPLLSPITRSAFKRHRRSTACHKRPTAACAELVNFREKNKLLTFRKCYFPTDLQNHLDYIILNVLWLQKKAEMVQGTNWTEIITQVLVIKAKKAVLLKYQCKNFHLNIGCTWSCVILSSKISYMFAFNLLSKQTFESLKV